MIKIITALSCGLISNQTKIGKIKMIAILLKTIHRSPDMNENHYYCFTMLETGIQ